MPIEQVLMIPLDEGRELTRADGRAVFRYWLHYGNPITGWHMRLPVQLGALALASVDDVPADGFYQVACLELVEDDAVTEAQGRKYRSYS